MIRLRLVWVRWVSFRDSNFSTCVSSAVFSCEAKTAHKRLDRSRFGVTVRINNHSLITIY